jgi:hypothetical protein
MPNVRVCLLALPREEHVRVCRRGIEAGVMIMTAVDANELQSRARQKRIRLESGRGGRGDDGGDC